MNHSDLLDELSQIPDHRRFGRVVGVMGMLLEVGGLPRRLAIGGHCVVSGQYAAARYPCGAVSGKSWILISGFQSCALMFPP